MFAIIAAIVFAIALLFDLLDVASDAFNSTTLMVLGLLFLSVHLAGYGTNWHTRGGGRRR